MCPILPMYLHLTWSFIFLYFQSRKASNKFLTIIKWSTNFQNGTRKVSFPAGRPKKGLLQRQSPTPDKTLYLRWDTSEFLMFQVGTQQVQPVPFPQKLRPPGLRFCAELDEAEVLSRWQSLACINTEYSMSFINEGQNYKRDLTVKGHWNFTLITKKKDTDKDLNVNYSLNCKDIFFKNLWSCCTFYFCHLCICYILHSLISRGQQMQVKMVCLV